jgi:DNA modification methylase
MNSAQCGKEVNGAETLYDDGTTQLIHGHVINALELIPRESVQCVVTSPPY